MYKLPILSLLVISLLSGCNWFDRENRRVISNQYTLYEEIDKGAAKEFIHHTKLFDIKVLYLESKGGSIYDAMDMIPYIESKQIKVVVRKGKHCDSSCTFLLLASKNREVKGILGIHEPTAGGQPYRFTTGNRRKVLDDIKHYMLELSRRNGVKDDFINDSWNVRNENLMWITGSTFNKIYVKQ